MKRYYFSKEKYIKSEGMDKYNIYNAWVDDADGKEVVNGRIVGTPYICTDYSRKIWCVFEEKTERKIVITYDGRTTTARLYEDEKVVKESKAVRNPADEEDFRIGADLAFHRLIGTPNEKKFLNCKICITESGCHDLTVGKIYKVEDGYFTDNSGEKYPYSGEAIKDIEDLKIYLSGTEENGRRYCNGSVSFVEVVE